MKSQIDVTEEEITEVFRGRSDMQHYPEIEEIARSNARKLDAIMAVLGREDISFGAMSEIRAILEREE